MDVFEAINTRRSIRRYKPDRVSEKDLITVLEAARQAPSWANTQCWRFIIVCDRTLIEALAGCLPETNRAAGAMRQAPLTIVACAEVGKSGFFDGQARTDKGEYWYMFDVGLAMQNLTLAAQALGLGTVHTGLFDARRAAALLNVPDGYCVVEMTPLGYPDEQPNVRPRKELSELVYHEKFGDSGTQV